ncbi:4-(cytidine 5'-diphospho)-2-C-methyl-D-erythritol kinase [bacterium]|nr:4-(cytidine 5'-diphospho)-2-C-methyl-D-erythritol kinase [bacterium]
MNSSTFKIPSFAKINLILRILGKRRDGFHTINTVLQTIDLHDELTFEFEPAKSFDVSLKFSNPKIPKDETNLIYRACKAFHKVHPLKHRVNVKVEKRIPIQSGLGGGSSNAASALIALSRFYKWPIPMKELHQIAGTLGSDVPFFLEGGTGLGTVRGDKIRKLEDWPDVNVLLVLPEVSCSTAAIYEEYDRRNLLTPESKSIKIRDVQRPESQRDYVSLVENDLERVVFALNPELDSIKKRLLKLGAIAAALTGSGSAIFGLFSDADEFERAHKAFPKSVRTRFVKRDEYRKALSVRSI